MTFPGMLDISRGIARGVKSLYRFGSDVIGTDFAPIVTGGVYYLPPPSGARPLRAVSTSASDTLLGTGGRILLVEGLDVNGIEISENLNMSGATPTAYTVNTFWRVHTVTIVASGTYGDPTTSPSYDGDVTLSDAQGVEWAVIDSGDLPSATWNSAFYTIPYGYSAYAVDFAVGLDNNKRSNIKFAIRQRADDVDSPSSWIVVNELNGLSGLFQRTLTAPYGPIDALTDIGVWGQSSQASGEIGVGYALVLSEGSC